MSYDLAVWEGDRPADDAAAGAEYKRLYKAYIEVAEFEPPTPRITAYVEALLARYPDISTEEGEDSPWSTGPLITEAVGPIIYFPMVWSQCVEVSEWAARVAHDHGLVCYDPQHSTLRP
ncbi:hypothetical protein [Catellatospora sichuanensis]|uniref:hypothetical protein n=1 Tax=Catellatospora sichuanensis TaxID=1969805 RepID=UPI00118364D2|nr:hypothetical protein [Catellatospora sichuanensis]